ADPESEARIGVLGNPDIRPERTVQYQFGFKQAVTPWLGVDVSAFYKDIRDLLGVAFVSTYNGAEYTRFTNVDFGNVIAYTPAIAAGFAGGLETNSGRKPSAVLLDLRGERPVRLARLDATLFGRVFNAFDSKFWNGFVFGTSGSPYYSRYPAKDLVTLANP